MRSSVLVFFLFLFDSAVIAQCDASKRPIVFMHGFLASGDTYAGQVQRFIDAGYCPERLFIFDWNSVSGNGKRTDSLLNVFIDEVLKRTGATQIDLVGHSAGGGLGRGYLIDSMHGLKVAHYIHLGSGKWFKEYNWYPNSNCLNIFSKGDKVAGSRAGVIEGAANLDLENKDHYEVATCMETFRAIYAFINEGKQVNLPASKEQEEVSIGGRAVLLGDNSPMKNALVNIYAVDANTGLREPRKGTATFGTGENGEWGPFKVRSNQHYEIELVPASADEKRISYFFNYFKKDDRHIYLRGFPQGNMISMMLGNMPSKDDQSVLAIYSSNKAMVAGRDSVTVNGIPICSEELTPASKTVISSFIYDDGDGKSSGQPLKQYKMTPFIGGVDISLPAAAKGVHSIYYNGCTLNLPAIPSNKAILLAVFN